jgi:SAM-dependent methyltransferase
MSDFGLDFKSLRDKWHEVPQQGGRVFSDDLLRLDRSKLLQRWGEYFSSYKRSESDCWYQILYREFMRGKSVLEIGSGLGFDGILRLQESLVRSWTFCDIAEINLQLVHAVCSELGVSGNLVYIDDEFKCFDKLEMFDVIWANGSLLHVPFDFARAECMAILPHLKPGGRWIELSYPRERWVREGRRAFSEWGKVTDGERTPWAEWYDLVKIKQRLFPAPLEVILDFNFHNDVYNWFDLRLTSDKPFDPRQSVLDLNIFPEGPQPELHGDACIAYVGGELQVTTPQPMWSYAASFDLATAVERSKVKVGRADNGFTLEVDVRVSRGHVGVLLVGEDVNAPVCQEYMATKNSEPTTLMIAVPPNAGARRIIFRNTAADSSSQFSLRRAQMRFVSGPMREFFG